MTARLLWAGLGSALGGLLRYGLTDLALRTIGPPFPWGTLTANVLGALLIGLLAGWLRAEGAPRLSAEAQVFLMGGFCGGLTTFSFLSWQVLFLAQLGAWGSVAAYLALTAGLGLGAVLLGYRLGARAPRPSRQVPPR